MGSSAVTLIKRSKGVPDSSRGCDPRAPRAHHPPSQWEEVRTLLGRLTGTAGAAQREPSISRKHGPSGQLLAARVGVDEGASDPGDTSRDARGKQWELSRRRSAKPRGVAPRAVRAEGITHPCPR